MKFWYLLPQVTQAAWNAPPSIFLFLIWQLWQGLSPCCNIRKAIRLLSIFKAVMGFFECVSKCMTADSLRLFLLWEDRCCASLEGAFLHCKSSLQISKNLHHRQQDLHLLLGVNHCFNRFSIRRFLSGCKAPSMVVDGSRAPG